MLTCNKNLFHYDPKSITAEASSLGLAPGEWPDFIGIMDDKGQTGFLVQFSHFGKCGEEILCAYYYDKTGVLPPVSIFND